jgi:hypothetical protein
MPTVLPEQNTDRFVWIKCLRTLVNAKKHFKFYKNEMPSLVNKIQTKRCLSVLLFETDQVRWLEVTPINSFNIFNIFFKRRYLFYLN